MRGLKYFRYLFLVTLLLFGFPNRNFAQFYNGSQQNFGKNRIQREDFIWTFYAFERFDTYFYTGGREIATYVSKKANGYISELEKYFEQPLTDRLQFLVFNRISDMKQSNVGFNDDEMYNTGGLTQITGTKILIFYDGNHKHLERQIRGGIAQVMLNQFVFGDNVGSMIKNSTLISFPNWYLQGLVSYLSEEWNTGIDNVVKDGIMTGKFRKFNDMEGRQAVLAGHSIWKYIADKYGRSIIPNIIYMAKISRNIESGFLLNLGVSFKSLMKEWIGHYKGIYGIFDESAEPPMKNTDTKKISKQKVVSKPCISNDGRYIGYATNMSGRFAVCLYDTEKKKNKVLYRGGHKLDETVDYNYPLMAFHPKMNVFSYMVERKGEILLNLYDLDEKTQDKVKMLYFSQILDFEYSDDGKTMVLSGVLYGKTDIFLYDIPSRSSTPVTNDYYDDVTPVFIRNSTEIVFASNRNSDSLSSGKLNADDAQDHFDLFSYSLTSPAMELKRLTKTELADEWQPEPYNSSTFSYLSDENGVFNRYVAAIDSSISFVDTVAHYQYFVSAYPTTHYKTGILEQDFNPRAGKYIELTFSRGRYKFCTSDIVVRESLERKTLTPTYFRTISKMFAERTVKTSTQSENKKTETRIINVSVKDTPKQTDTIPLKEGKVDIYNYVFDIEKPKKKITYASNDTIVSLTEDSPPLFILPRQRNYEVEFYLNKLVTQADFNYMNEIYQPFTGSYNPGFINPGFNGLIKMGVCDLLEDYRITGGLRLSTSLTNNSYLLQIDNYKKRLDRSWIFYRQATETFGYYLVDIKSHAIKYHLRYPFSTISAIRGDALFRTDRYVYKSLDVNTLREPNEDQFWFGLKMEYVYDNARERSLNILTGTKLKFFAEHYRQVDEKKTGISIIGFDFRHYHKIHKCMIFAIRGAGSTSFGERKLIYYLGGVDNWIFPKFNGNINIDYSRNYIFQSLATNMRGFPQNIRNGNSFLLWNNELRLPVFRYLFNKPLKSDFLNNFQIIGFSDIGTAWTGLNPYSPENSLFTQVIQQGPIKVTLENLREPIVVGYGFGLRTRLTGYFLRADWGWGWEDGYVMKPLFHLSLGLDF